MRTQVEADYDIAGIKITRFDNQGNVNKTLRAQPTCRYIRASLNAFAQELQSFADDRPEVEPIENKEYCEVHLGFYNVGMIYRETNE